VITVLDEQLTDEHQLYAWQSEMTETILRAVPYGVIINMKNVKRMTSAGVFSLFASRAVADEIGAKFTLCNLSTALMNVLTSTQRIVESHNANHLAIADSVDDAIAAMSFGHGQPQ
jgi:anti-anti-sigma regulatory factor